MSVIAVGSTSRARKTDESVTKSLEIALSEFGSVLTDGERKQLHQIKGVPDASAALVFTAKLDTSNSTRRGKSIGARAYSMLQSVQNFSAIVDTFISAHPDIAALVWGGVKLTVLVAANITSYFESLADLFMGLNKLFPQFDEYQLLFPNSPTLQESICTFHASIVQLCKHAILLTRQPWIKKMALDFRGKLRPQIENIQICSKDVKKAISLAKATSDLEEINFQKQERKLAAKHRKQLSIFASRSQKELESAREWQVQRHQDLLREKNIRLLDSLSTYAYQKNFHQTRKKRHINTATWLFSTSEFIKWKDGEEASVFILTGKLGSGKTVLTSSVIDYLCCERTRPDELTTFAFPRFDDSTSLTAATVLRSIIRQSLKPEDVTGEIERLLSSVGVYMDMDVIETLLKHCISRFSTIHIVIDALDEFEKEERNILLQSLSSVISSPNSIAKLFLVGRNSVSRDIRKWFPAYQEKSADCYQVRANINTYTEETISLRMEEELIPEDTALAKEIITALIDGADGMFLWVDYQIAEICECTCDNEIREVLRTLPKNLGETFDRAAKRIAKRGYAKTASHIFQWAAATKRPLTLDELREALSYEPGILYSIAGKRPNGLERITGWCENLVQLDTELQTVQFTHHSVLKHFLEQSSDPNLQKFHINLEEADHVVGEICVTYLNSSEFKTDLIRNPGALPAHLPRHVIETTLEVRGVPSRIIQKLNASSYRKSTSSKESVIVTQNDLEDPMITLKSGHPFLKYASDYWLLHTRNFEEGRSKTWNLWKQIIRGEHGLAKTPWSAAQFQNQGSIVFNWVDMHDHFVMFIQAISIAKLSNINRNDLIRRYANLGRLRYMNILIDLAENKEELSRGLQYAALAGHLRVVQRLLDAGADVNVVAPEFRETILQTAAVGDHSEIVQRCLDAGADVNAGAGEFEGTALQAAAGHGHLKTVQILLDAGADVNAAAAKYGQTALQAAAACGSLKTVQTLLDAGADVDTGAGEFGGTALQIAARHGYSKIAQILLDAGADVNVGPKYGQTALQAAADGGHIRVVKMLLDARADVNTTVEYGQLALQVAAKHGHLEIVQTLLDTNVDVNAAAAPPYGRTALQVAAECGHLEIVQRLLDAGADVNAAADEFGGTALQTAARGGHLEVVRILLNANADVNAAVAKYGGRTALEAAVAGSNLEMVSLLKSAGARR